MTTRKITTEGIFRKVAKHLLTQGKRAYGKENQCKYRGEGGTSCAVGCIIKDEFYSEELEGKSVVSLKYLLGEPVTIRDRQKKLHRAVSRSMDRRLMEDDVNLLRSLQFIHDTHLPSEWHRSLTRLADASGFKMPKVPAPANEDPLSTTTKEAAI